MAKYFKTKHKYIGKIKTGTRQEFFIEALPDIPEIKEIQTSCGCSAGKLTGNSLKISFKAGYVPLHLKHVGEYEVTQSIKVLYVNGEEDNISFSAKVFE